MTKKVFLTDSNMANFICPECGTLRTVDVSQYKHIDRPVKLKCKCPCGHRYPVFLERRKHYRFETNLQGIYICISNKENDRGLINVTDLSRTGLKFNLRLNRKPNFEVGDTLLVEFNLDDELRSLIKKEVFVRNISGPNVGAQFSSEDHYDALGHYLFSRSA